MNPIISLEQEGLAAMKSRNYHSAVKIFQKITELSPEYEHGSAFYDLACALEAIGESKKAKTAYQKALSYDPTNSIWLEAYTDFMSVSNS